MMQKNHPSQSLPARLKAIVDKVAHALRDEARDHGSEPWDDVCRRVSKHLSVWVNLSEDPSRWIPESNNPTFLRPSTPHGNKHFETAIRECFVVTGEARQWSFWFRLCDWPSGSATPSERSVECADDGDREQERNKVGPTKSPLWAAESAKGAPVFNPVFLIREFDRRERERGPIFAGFIVKDLLPRMGFDPSEAKRILRAMEAQDIIRTERKRNPKAPERTTAFVTLNRQHPDVVRVLEGKNSTQRTFPIASIEGEPLSEFIIRERR